VVSLAGNANNAAAVQHAAVYILARPEMTQLNFLRRREVERSETGEFNVAKK